MDLQSYNSLLGSGTWNDDPQALGESDPIPPRLPIITRGESTSTRPCWTFHKHRCESSIVLWRSPPCCYLQPIFQGQLSAPESYMETRTRCDLVLDSGPAKDSAWSTLNPKGARERAWKRMEQWPHGLILMAGWQSLLAHGCSAFNTRSASL